MDTLFYDGQCPLCTREIRILQRIADTELRLVDVHSLDNPELWPGVTRQQLLQRLYLLDSEGWYWTGLYATVRTWRHTPFGVFFRILLLPGIRPLAQAVYERWAARRFCALYGCAIQPDRH